MRVKSQVHVRCYWPWETTRSFDTEVLEYITEYLWNEAHDMIVKELSGLSSDIEEIDTDEIEDCVVIIMNETDNPYDTDFLSAEIDYRLESVWDELVKRAKDCWKDEVTELDSEDSEEECWDAESQDDVDECWDADIPEVSGCWNTEDTDQKPSDNVWNTNNNTKSDSWNVW